MSDIIMKDPEFGYTIRYTPSEGFIDWEVSNEDGDVLMIGKFDSKDYYKSVFTLVPSNVEENIYENLFYLYFENIKLKCIDMVEGDESIGDEDYDK
jgi:hypothetical protein